MGGGQVQDGEPNKTQTSQMDLETTGTIVRDKYDKIVIGSYEHGVLTPLRERTAHPFATLQNTDVPRMSRSFS